MSDHPASSPSDSPNDVRSANPGAIFYVSKAILLSYFDIFRTFSRQSKTKSEAVPPLFQTAITARFPSPEPCMAIV